MRQIVLFDIKRGYLYHRIETGEKISNFPLLTNIGQFGIYLAESKHVYQVYTINVIRARSHRIIKCQYVTFFILNKRCY